MPGDSGVGMPRAHIPGAWRCCEKVLIQDCLYGQLSTGVGRRCGVGVWHFGGAGDNDNPILPVSEKKAAGFIRVSGPC